MCLSVYLGTSKPLTIPGSMSVGALGIEKAKWTPPPLRAHAFCYYLGDNRHGSPLGCSCLLLEHLLWNEPRPTIEPDMIDASDIVCPFVVLRSYCEIALADKMYVTLVSDDSGGLEQTGDESDFHELVLPTLQIRRGNLLFAGSSGDIPWRKFVVILAEPENSGPA